MQILKRASISYKKEGLLGKMLYIAIGFSLLCCICLIPITLFSPDTATPQPLEAIADTALPTVEVGTPTPIPPTSTIQLDFTDTPIPTETPLPQSATPTETQFVLSTATNISSSSNIVIIIGVNKSAEYVDIKNNSSEPVNLSGWLLVSERGNQSCVLGGVIQPNEVLRIWAMNGDGGYSCGYSTNIWNNSESDPAVLYNPQGQEVSRY